MRIRERGMSVRLFPSYDCLFKCALECFGVRVISLYMCCFVQTVRSLRKPRGVNNAGMVCLNTYKFRPIRAKATIIWSPTVALRHVIQSHVTRWGWRFTMKHDLIEGSLDGKIWLPNCVGPDECFWARGPVDVFIVLVSRSTLNGPE